MVLVKQAEFLEKGTHRMSLHRAWNYRRPQTLFIGINPSVASATQDDHTVRKLTGFCERWRDGGFYICNLYTHVATNHRELLKAKEPCHRLKWHFINLASNHCDRVVFMWGNKKFIPKVMVQEMMDKFPKAMCFGITKGGHPVHPLMLSYKTKLMPFNEYIHPGY